MNDVPDVAYGRASDQAVRNALFLGGGGNHFVEREIEVLGNNTPIVTAPYPQEPQCYIPWLNYLTARESLGAVRKINSEACQYVDDHLSEVMHKQVKLDGEDAAIELTLDALNGLLEVLGMEEIKTTRVFEVNLTATADFTIRVEANSAEEAEEMVQTEQESEFTYAMGSLRTTFSDCDLDGCDVTVDYTEAVS